MAKKKIQNNTFELVKRTELDEKFVPVVHNLLSQGYDLADVGMLLGFAGKHPERWLKQLSEKIPDLQKAIELGTQAANIQLIKTAFQEATGYWIEEEEIYAEIEKIFPVPNVNNGGPLATGIKPYYRYRDKSRKTKKKFIQPNTQLLFKLLCCRLPQYFSDTRNIQIDKRSLELKGNVEEEIRNFAGALMEAAGAKKVDSREIIDNEDS